MSMNEPGAVDKVAARIDVDFSPAKTSLTDFADAYKKAFQEISAQPLGLTQQKGSNTFITDATGAMRTLQQEIKNLQLSFKEGSLSAQDLYSKVADLKNAYVGAFDPTTKTGIANTDAFRQALIDAQNQISKLQDFEMQSEQRIISQKQAADEAYTKWWEGQLAQQEADQQKMLKQQAADEANAIDTRLKNIKMYYDTKLSTAQDSLTKIEALMNEETQYFVDNQNKRIEALKQAATYEDAINKQSMSAVPSFSSSGGSGIRGGFGVLGMASMMGEFTGISMLAQNIHTGIVQITKDQQGLQQVFGQNISGQQQLNQVTNSFIGIAEQMGQSLDSVMTSAKQVGRQYHDVATAQQMVRSATILSITDNLQMVDATKALESIMNAYQMSIGNAAEMEQSSMAITDQFVNLAHNASVSAQDLAHGVEVSAGAAKQAGVTLQQMEALISATVRSTGESGNVAGTMWKTILAHISSDTPKIQKAFETLGISMKNADGSMRPVYDMILQIAKESGNLDAAQKQALMTITGGVRQYSRFASSISNVTTIQNDYNLAMNSAGAANKYAQEQMHTLSAELTRLKDAIQQMAYNVGSGGLGDVLKGLVVGVTDLIEGLQKLPPVVTIGGAALAGLLLSGRMLTTASQNLRDMLDGLGASVKFLKDPIGALSAAWQDMSVKVRTVTTDLAAKTAATDAEVVANEAMAASSAATVAGLEAEAEAAGVATGAFEELDVASGGLALIIGAAVTGLGMWAVHAATASQATQQQTQDTQALTQAYTAHKAQVDDLLTQYQQLEQATQDGTVFKDTQQQQDYYSVMNQIAGILPNVTDYTDKNGQAHIQSANAIKKEIDQQQKLLQLQAQATIASGPSDLQKQVQAYQNAVISFNQANQEALTGTEQAITHVNALTGDKTVVSRVLSPAEIANIRNQLVQYQSAMDGATNAITQENQKLAQAMVSVSGTQLTDQSQGILSGLIGNLDISKFNGDTAQITSAVQGIVDEVVKLQQSSSGGKISMDAQSAAVESLSQKYPMLKQAITDTTSAENSATTSTNDLAQKLSDATANATILNQAQQELANQHRLSQTTLDALTKAYPAFDQAIGGGESAMESFINKAKEQEQQTIDTQRSMTEAVINGVTSRIKAIQAEIQAMQQEAMAQAAMVSNLTSSGAINIRNPAIQGFIQNSNQLPELQAVLSAAQASLGQINVAQYTVDNSGYTGSGPKGTNAKGTSASAYTAPFQSLSSDDTNALQKYVTQVDTTSTSMNDLNTQLSDADNNMKNNIGSLSALNQVTSTYNQYVKSVKDNQAALTAENDKAHQLLQTINADEAQVNEQFKRGVISAQAHKDAINALGSEWSKLTSTIKTNEAAINADNRALDSATKTITSEITAELKQAYTDQKQIEEQRLQNIYQPEIDALTAQKDAVDNLMKSLDDQYNIENAQYKLQQDQTNLTNEMTQNKSFRVVNADGSISWTYDTTKVQQMQHTVLDDQHNLQKSELQQQSDNLAAQLKQVQDTYNKQKQELDSYWSYKLSTDTLNNETDNLILQHGLIGADQLVTKYAGSMITTYNSLQASATAAGSAIAASLGGQGLASSLGGAGLTSSTPALNSYWQNVKNAGGAYANPTGNGMTLAQQKAHEAALYGIPVSDVQTTANGQTFVPWQYVQNHAIAASAPSWNSPAAGMTTAGSSVSTNNSKVVNLNVANVNVNQQSDMNYLIDQINSALG